MQPGGPHLFICIASCQNYASLTGQYPPFIILKFPEYMEQKFTSNDATSRTTEASFIWLHSIRAKVTVVGRYQLRFMFLVFISLNFKCALMFVCNLTKPVTDFLQTILIQPTYAQSSSTFHSNFQRVRVSDIFTYQEIVPCTML